MRRFLSDFLLLSILAPPAWAGTDLRDVSPAGFAGSDTAALGTAGDPRVVRSGALAPA